MATEKGADKKPNAPAEGPVPYSLRLPSLHRHSSESAGHMYFDRTKLSEGAQGTLHRALTTKGIVRNQPKAVVLKCPRKSTLQLSEQFKLPPSTQGRQALLKEAIVLEQLRDQQGVARLLDFFQETDTAQLYLVIDHIAGHDMADVVIDNPYQLSMAQQQRHFWTVAQQLVSIVAFLHGRGIVHQDIRPENIMLTPEHAAGAICRFKVTLIDFGHAVIVDPELYNDWDQDPSLSALLKVQAVPAARSLGTAFISPPEYFCGEVASAEDYKKIDVFATGITLYMWAFGEPEPFEERQTVCWEKPVTSADVKYRSDPRVLKNLTYLEQGHTPDDQAMNDLISELVHPDHRFRASLTWAAEKIRTHLLSRETKAE